MVMPYRKQSTEHMETIRVYKLFRQNDHGILFPLFIDTKKSVPIGEWVKARAPNDEVLKELDEGYSLIDLPSQTMVAYQRTQKPHRNQVLSASHLQRRWVEVRTTKRGRKVYDIGIGSDGQVLHFAHRPGWHSSATPLLPAVDMTGKVWTECLIPADDYYTLHRNLNGLSKEHGAIDWFISQRIMITKVMDATQ